MANNTAEAELYAKFGLTPTGEAPDSGQVDAQPSARMGVSPVPAPPAVEKSTEANDAGVAALYSRFGLTSTGEAPETRKSVSGTSAIVSKPRSTPVARGTVHTQPTIYHQAPIKQPGEKDLTVGETLRGASSNLIPSAIGVVGSFGHALTHPGETLGALGDIGTGLLSKAAGAAGAQQDPAKKKQEERAVDAMWNHYKKTYFTSSQDFMRAFKNDPASILLDFSTLTGVGSAALPAKAAKVAKLAATAMDPVQLGLSVAKQGLKGTLATTRGLQTASGVKYNVLKNIYDIGKSGDPEIRNAFKAANKGNVDAQAYAEKLKDQLTQHYDDKTDNFVAGLSKAKDAPAADYSNVYRVIDENDVHPDYRIEGERYSIDSARALIDKAASRTSSIYDQHRLKKELDRLADRAPTKVDADAVRAVKTALTDSMSLASPEYAQLMRQYQNSLSQINDFKKYVTSGNTAGATANLLKGINSLSKKEKAEVLKAFSKDDKTIIPTLAGLATQDIWRGGGTGIAEGVAAAISGLGFLPFVHPLTAAGIALSSSPKLAAKTQYMLGRTAPYAAGAVSRPVTSGAYYGERALQEEGQQPDEGASKETSDLSSIKEKIANVESAGSGGYSAVGPVDPKSGERPYGKYQVMGFNIPKWTKQYLGVEMTPEEFLNDPAAQEKVFEGAFGGALKKYGNLKDAASWWHSGKPLSQAQGRRDVLGTSTPDYVNRVTEQADGGRIGRATGGRIMNHRSEAENLIRLADKTKKALNNSTESLLAVPDEAVTKALSIANEAI